jgi:tRNA A37 threonylcarbamoyladenosine dehydratase
MTTHTYAILDVSKRTYDEIAQKLRDAQYDHAFDRDVIDMHGIALRVDPASVVAKQFIDTALDELASTLRERTWLASVSAEEMNRRDRWLADQLASIQRAIND